ncbi:MAG: glycosyltransferase family 4 protein [Ignavibacteria bacterium]|nr:glycosyltransferase family 4 protein [Ignavibacteria bacterium]
MKILVLNWQDIKNPLGGGAEVHLHEIFKRIAVQGHAVTLFCCSFAGAKREEWVDGIRVLRQGHRSLFNFLVAPRYRWQFRHEQYDVVVDDINKIPFYSPLYVKEPLVGIVHHFFGKSIFLEASLPAATYVAASEKLAARVYRNTPLAVVSESTRQELIELGFSADKMFIVPNCVDHSSYRPAEQPESARLIVGHLGRLKKYKSVDHLLRAFQIVSQEVPEARLVIIGEGNHRSELERLARALRLSDVVQFTGYLTKEETVRQLHQMSLAVSCSIKEGWGLTVIEANACGVPVIASDVPGLRDSVVDEKTGLLYEYGNIEQLAQKILLLLRDEHLRTRLRNEAITWAQSFDWNESAKKMIDLMEWARTSKG